jgi:hypothetical protein
MLLSQFKLIRVVEDCQFKHLLSLAAYVLEGEFAVSPQREIFTASY